MRNLPSIVSGSHHAASVVAGNPQSANSGATVKGGAEVGGVVRFLGEHGFVVADIIGLKRRPLDGATAQLDLLFVPDNAPLRADRRWASG